ncbi:jg1682 [Pararge aegeria aegeria]|uniref:Jg1682 protein n=1 Tax=Pararge aegeria aegeria TaxID=348720 RepID=A0A8S4RFS9_9NEOP|nr:jg1682 [Pararge aegeria aegeria]
MVYRTPPIRGGFGGSPLSELDLPNWIVCPRLVIVGNSALVYNFECRVPYYWVERDMSVIHNCRLAHVHTKAHLLRNSAEVIQHRIKISQSLCHYEKIVAKRKLSDVLAVDVDAKPVSIQKL